MHIKVGGGCGIENVARSLEAIWTKEDSGCVLL